MAGWANALAAADNPAADANPYSVISDRNVFHLVPPPPPPPPPEPKALDLPKVMLTGFVGRGSSVKIYLAIPPRDNKDTIYYSSGLVPGDKVKDVELVRINYDKKEVDIINSGTPQTLSIKSNTYLTSASAPSSGKAAGPPGMPAGIGLHHQPPGGPQPGPPQAAPSAAVGPSRGGSPIVAGGGGDNSSAIVVGGGGGGNSGSPYAPLASSSSGTIVSGAAPYVAPAATTAGNAVANQLATSLFNGQNNRQTSAPNPYAVPIPLPAQAAHLLIQEAAGGPPSPIHMDEDPGDGPPPPP